MDHILRLRLRSIWMPLLLLAFCTGSFCFQSDELQEDEDEWGLVGGNRKSDAASIASSFSSPSLSDLEPPRRSPKSSSGSSGDAPVDSRIQFNLEHAFGNSEFSLAGTFSGRLRTLPNGAQIISKLRLARNSFTEKEQASFIGLVDKDSFYKIRIPANLVNPDGTWILSSTKARCLSGADLQERFDIYMENGFMIGVGYGAAGDCQYPRSLRYPSKWTPSSHLVLRSGEQAPRLVPVLDVAQEIADGQVEKKEPEKSFWAKYWIYILPLGIIVMNVITQVANMPEEQAAAAQGGAAAPRAVTAGPRRR